MGRGDSYRVNGHKVEKCVCRQYLAIKGGCDEGILRC